MALTMNREEREAFLADCHVGVISIEENAGSAPLSVPVWYDYAPDTGLWILTGENSRKGRALAAAGRFTLCAQVEDPARYAYVSVSGPIVSVRTSDKELDARPMARRYLGEKIGDLYVESGEAEGSTIYRMEPEQWLTVDYGKLEELSDD